MPRLRNQNSFLNCVQVDEEINHKLVNEAVKAILTLDKSKRPIKHSDIFNAVNIKIKRKQAEEFWTLVRRELDEMGMGLSDCETGQTKAFILTQKCDNLSWLRDFASVEERADRTLLTLILTFIFMKDGLAYEDEVFRHLAQLDISANGSCHDYFGDVKKKIQSKFVEQMYLNRLVQPEEDNVELRWGQRAVLEVSPMLILDFVCAVGYDGKMEPCNWAAQYEKAKNGLSHSID